jgi:hypothetical protein
MKRLRLGWLLGFCVAAGVMAAPPAGTAVGGSAARGIAAGASAAVTSG